MKPLLQILGLWRGRAGWLAGGLAVSLASVGAGVALLTLAGAHVAVLVMGGGIAAGALLQVLGPVRVALRYLERLVTHAATFRALADLRAWFFRGLARQSAGGLGMRSSGDVAARIVADVEALDGLYLRILVPLAAALLLLPALVLVFAMGDTPWLDAGVVLLFVAAAFLAPAMAARGAQAAGVRLAESGAALRVAVTDAFSGLREVRAFGAEERVLGIVSERDDDWAAAQVAVAGRAAVAQAVAFLCGQAALLLVLLAAGTRPAYAVGALFLAVAAFEVSPGCLGRAPWPAMPPPRRAGCWRRRAATPPCRNPLPRLRCRRARPCASRQSGSAGSRTGRSCSTACPWTCRRARGWRSWGRPARASPPWPRCC